MISERKSLKDISHIKDHIYNARQDITKQDFGSADMNLRLAECLIRSMIEREMKARREHD